MTRLSFNSKMKELSKVIKKEERSEGRGEKVKHLDCLSAHSWFGRWFGETELMWTQGSGLKQRKRPIIDFSSLSSPHRTGW